VTVLDLTTEAYGRWLRSCRPPLELFLSFADDEQESLAMIGDDYSAGLCLAMAAAIAGPATDPADEVAMVQQLAAAAVERLTGQRAPDRQPAAPTMGGSGKRRAAAASPSRSFLGTPSKATP
jgi:hypothetical protein